MNSWIKLMYVIAFTLALMLVGIIVSLLNADATELHFYDVYGQNRQTGLMVAGRLWESDKEGNLHGKVYDEMTVQDQCNGTWVGYGVAQVGCGNGHQYVLRVVEK